MKLSSAEIDAFVHPLKALAIFAGCSDGQLKAMLGRVESVSYAKEKVVLMEQEISRTLFVLVQGSVGIWRRKGGEKLLLAALKAPDFFGESSMFLEYPANALVKTQEPSRLLMLSRDAFNDMAGRDATFGLLIEKNLAAIEEQRPPLLKKEVSE
ncbi:MAG TPA: cyclic nucleotide-binding domain-containing protein [Elusimicrobiota bacterium]|nr:cyclic nucleotide-binding domain-containing protein [Elusimicrobiota bacterium]